VSTAAEKLDEARVLIERGWTQGEYARGEKGSSVDYLKDKATCFCAAGAIGAVNKHWPTSSLPGMRYLSLAVGGDGDEADVLNWNDAPERTQAEVVEAFRKAAELARGEAA
jgi:hypothetical protein